MAAGEKYKAKQNNVNNNNVEGAAEEVPKTQDEINAENNANTIKNAAEVASNSANPYAKAIGTAVKMADKYSGGKATQKLGETMNKANKIAPGGRQIQNASNKLSESGVGDKIGQAAASKNGGTTTTSSSGGTSKSSSKITGSGSNNVNTSSAFKIVAIGLLSLILPLLFFVTIFAEDDDINMTLTNNSSMSSSGGQHLNNIIYYNQKNYNNSYGYGETIAAAGCGPTAMAMVISTLTNSTVTPVDTADWSLKNGYRVASGTSWEFFPAISSEYGITCENISLDADSITNSLNQGKLIILSVRPNTTFAPYSSGHFIVLTGVDSEGKISVADPYNEEANNLTYFIETFVNDGRAGGIWAFSK